MADFSSYTHKWRATNTNLNNQADAHKVVKRNRQPTSCQPCRLRKLKCDRGHPCEACTKRDEASACSYGKAVSLLTSPASASHQSRHNGDVYNPPSSLKAQDRLRQLEDLVRQIAAPKPGGTHRESHTDDLSGNDFNQRDIDTTAEGPLNRDRHGVSYTGSTHWSAVLDQIQDLRSSLSTGDSLSSTSSPRDAAVEDPSTTSPMNHEAASRASTLFGAVHPPSLQAVIQSYLPPRKVVDRHLSVYFNARYLIIPFVHTEQFNRQYEAFWKDQLSTSPMWVSMLFSIICIADNIRKTRVHDNPANSGKPFARDHFLAGAAQCLVLGDYTQPQSHLVEALAFYIQCRFAMSLDPSRELGLVLSVLTRQAFTMGYHRDPSKFPNQFTPFEGEQRRRCWAALKQFDLMIAFQLGIPQTIPPHSADTQIPRNILDSDFDENSSVLPPSRPDTEPTTMLYFVVKARLMDVYSKVIQHNLSFMNQIPTQAQIMDLHADIDQASNSIPLCLRVRAMSSSFSDPSYFIMLRTNLYFLAQKSYCVLHRKYVTRNTADAAYCREACLDASVKIASHFMDLHSETGPGGQLHVDQWMISSFTVNDFLLAAMLICLIMWQDRKDAAKKYQDVTTWFDRNGRARECYEMIVKIHRVCKEYSMRSVESKRVEEVLSVVIAKLKPTQATGSAMRRSSAMDESGLPSKTNTNGDQHVALDLTPLSMNNHPSPPQPSTTISLNENPFIDSSPTWIYNFAPAISSIPTMTTALTPPSQSIFLMPNVTASASSSLRSESPFTSLLNGSPATGPDSIDMEIDWASFDQFLAATSGGGNGGGLYVGEWSMDGVES